MPNHSEPKTASENSAGTPPFCPSSCNSTISVIDVNLYNHKPLFKHGFAAHGNLLAALSILVRLCNHPRLLLPTAATIKKQQQQRERRTPSKTPSKAPTVPTEIPFQNSDDEALEEGYGYAQLVAQLPLPLQQQLQHHISPELIAQHGAKVLFPRPCAAVAVFLHPQPPPRPPTCPSPKNNPCCPKVGKSHSTRAAGVSAAVAAPFPSRSGASHSYILPVTRHA